MTEVDADLAWRAAVASADADRDGDDIRRSQGLWALAIRTGLSDEDVRCDGDVLGPVLTPGGFVVHRCWVRVEAGDPARTRDACDDAWRRWTRVDELGFEVEPDPDDEAPDPFGYPDVDGGSVVLAFDAREDEDPFPQRALTCLRILVEELRRHGCTPARLTNPLHLPDDEGVDAEALADDLAAAGEPRPVDWPAPPIRPDWLPAFHEVDRARAGRPDGPVPFVLLANDKALAWDPHHGLLRLPRAEPEADARHVVMERTSLSADGTRLTYRRSPGAASQLPRDTVGTLDLRSGAVSLASSGRIQVFESASGDLRLEVEPPPYETPYADMDDRFRLVDRSGNGRDLPLRDHLLPVSAGPAAQFSPSGRLLVTCHHSTLGGDYIVCTDVATGQGREYFDRTDPIHRGRLLGNPSWSPDESRVLIERGTTPYVLDLATGDSEDVAVHRLGAEDPDAWPWQALGFLDDDGLLMSLRHGRRIRLAYQPLQGTTRHHVLDIPATASPGSTIGLTIAPALLRESPHLIGYHPR